MITVSEGVLHTVTTSLLAVASEEVKYENGCGLQDSTDK